jgi:hypothetical protein
MIVLLEIEQIERIENSAKNVFSKQTISSFKKAKYI